MSELHPALAAFAAERSSAFTALVGIEFAAIERGLCTLRLPIDDKHFNSTGRVHGGVVFTLLDSAMGASAFSVLEPHESTATIE